MTKTGDPKLIAELNNLLGRELGRNPYGAPIFSWAWSEDLWWPASATGRMIEVVHNVRVPIFHAETGYVVDHQDVPLPERRPEYARTRMCRMIDTWYIAQWMPPETLIYGGSQGHGRGYADGAEPDYEALSAIWQQRFPGADFPSQGMRIPTDAWLPRSPDDPAVPNRADTEHFIACIREQTRLSHAARLADDLAKMDKRDEATTAPIVDELSDSYSAFLNEKPGARGNSVSMPWTKADRER